MDQKVRGVLAYVFIPIYPLISWVGGLIVLLAFKDNTKETNFNACQAIVLGVIYLIINTLVNILLGILVGILVAARVPFAGVIQTIANIIPWVLRIGVIALSVIGMVRAYQETEFNIPLIGDLTKKIFKSKLA